MLVQSWLQVPYTEHSSKSVGKRARMLSFPGEEGWEECALRRHHWECPSPQLLQGTT